MIEPEVIEVFSRVLRDLLSDQSITLTMTTRREDVPNWDSFNYINFIVSIESELGMKFRLVDIESFETIGDIVAKCI
jgi:acyl carrier protein